MTRCIECEFEYGVAWEACPQCSRRKHRGKALAMASMDAALALLLSPPLALLFVALWIFQLPRKLALGGTELLTAARERARREQPLVRERSRWWRIATRRVVKR